MYSMLHLHGLTGLTGPLAQDGKTDYKSVTIAEDATAQEFMDFYLDDDARAQWVSHSSSIAHIQADCGRTACSGPKLPCQACWHLVRRPW